MKEIGGLEEVGRNIHLHGSCHKTDNTITNQIDAGFEAVFIGSAGLLTCGYSGENLCGVYSATNIQSASI